MNPSSDNLRIAKGAWLYLVAAASGMLLAFVGRLLLARFYTQSEFGVFTLAWIVLNFGSLVALLGFQESSTRQIAYHRSRNETDEAAILVRKTLILITITSTLIAIAIFLTSPLIASGLNEPRLADVLKMFAIAIPLLALTHLLAAIFRGFGQVKPKIIFFDLMRNGLFPLLLLPFGLLGVSFLPSMSSLLLACTITATTFLAYARKKLPQSKKPVDVKLKPLITFSLPVLVLVVSSTIVSWTDTVMLGYFKTSDIVGLYNGAWSVAQLLLLPVAAISFLFLPKAATLHEQGQISELKRSYTVTTRWIFGLAMPILITFLLFPKPLLSLLFGPTYIGAHNVLRLLSIAYAFHFLFGPAHSMLTATGKTKSLLAASLLGVSLNICLNYFLIPTWGIMGASTATVASFLLMYGLLALRLKAIGLHPFGRDWYKWAPEDVQIFQYIIRRTKTK